MCLLANAVCHKWNVIVWPWHDGKLRQTFFLFGTDSLTEMNSCQLMFGHCHRAHVALLNIQTMIYFFVGTGGFPFPHCDILGKRNGNFSVNDLHVEGQKKKEDKRQRPSTLLRHQVCFPSVQVVRVKHKSSMGRLRYAISRRNSFSYSNIKRNLRELYADRKSLKRWATLVKILSTRRSFLMRFSFY